MAIALLIIVILLLVNILTFVIKVRNHFTPRGEVSSHRFLVLCDEKTKTGVGERYTLYTYIYI